MRHKAKSTGHGPCPKCKSSDAHYNWPNGSSHCFSCNYHSNEGQSLEQIKESLTQGNISLITNITLPGDFEYYIPVLSKVWLDKYNLTITEIRKNKIGYSQSRESIIFPVVSAISGGLLMYQARYCGSDPKVPKWRTTGAKGGIFHIPDPHPTNLVVLVEDMVSAIKCCRVTNAAPLFGSAISTEIIDKLKKQGFKRARIWLDPDKRQQAVKEAILLTECGIPCTLILTDKDPKDYGTADIRSIIGPLEIH